MEGGGAPLGDEDALRLEDELQLEEELPCEELLQPVEPRLGDLLRSDELQVFLLEEELRIREEEQAALLAEEELLVECPLCPVHDHQPVLEPEGLLEA